MLKKISLLFVALAVSGSIFAQKLEFTTVKANPITSIKDQNRSGTCWCFSTISFLESEAIRINNIKDTLSYPDFSEMFVVSQSYKDRADKYIRTDGNIGFAAGSECEDVLHVMSDYGLVPQSVMPGFNYGTELPVHGELDAATKSFVDAIVKNPNRTLSTAWKRAFAGIVDAYLGQCPTEFEYNGEKYTPASYRDSYKLNSDDYVSLTSFTHKPYYKEFELELSDNWRADLSYNIPLEELSEVMYYAIEHGFTFAWGGDVSETGFTRAGLALNLDKTKKSTIGSDLERWLGKKDEKSDEKKEATAPVEAPVTAESRQIEYDNKSTTDDHGMHAFGIATDQFGGKYFMIKNSWGKTGDYKGIWYMSDAFNKAKVINIVVHKDALPKELKKKLGIK